MGQVGNYQGQLYGQVRTMRADLEEKVSTTSRLDHKIVAWILYYASWLLAHFLDHGDGKTSFERRWARPFNGAISRFGERLLYLNPRDSRYKLGPKLSFGMYCGRDHETNEAMMITAAGKVISARTTRRAPKSEQWNVLSFLERLNQVRGSKRCTRQRLRRVRLYH